MLDVRLQDKSFPTPNGGERKILHDIRFSAVAGEVIAVLGSSGIGKSTMLRICARLDFDFKGYVRLSTSTLGIMFQEPRLLPWLTVEQNLRLVAPAVDVTAVLQAVMLPGVEELLPSTLSLGMARRVALARALAVDPTTLVLDEPFASLDRGLGQALGTRIADRAEQSGMLVLLSLHDIDQAFAMAGRILVLSDNPATLSADVAVPARGDGTATVQLRHELLTRFAFLDRSDRGEA